MTYVTEVNSDSPALWWRLDEPALAATAVDTSPNARSGTYNGTFSMGEQGISGDGDFAARFFGDLIPVSFVERAYEAWMDFLNRATFTVEVWVKPNIVDLNYRRIIGHNTWSPVQDGWHMAYQSGAFYFERAVAGVPVGVYLGPLSIDTWYHIVATYDGTNLNLYMNGALAGGPVSATTNNIALSTIPLRVGCDASYQGDGSEATIDEVAIYTTALSAARVSAHFAAALVPAVSPYQRFAGIRRPTSIRGYSRR